MKTFCSKCGSDDVLTMFVKDGSIINTSSYNAVDSEFIYSIEYDVFYKLKAKKDHLHKYCQNCQHDWRDVTAEENIDAD